VGTHIVLLRGINVGAHNRIPMAALREMLAGLGHSAVRTLLNSGNAVVTCEQEDPAAVAGQIRAAIADTFGLDITTVVRSRAQIERVIDRNPMPEQAGEAPKLFQVGFSVDTPEPGRFDVIDRSAIEPDRLVEDEGTIYTWFPDGMRDSRLAAALTRSKLDRLVTLRNWNTVGKLLDLAGG
jgi:uncharacterized protein (DUF1697 family)